MSFRIPGFDTGAETGMSHLEDYHMYTTLIFIRNI